MPQEPSLALLQQSPLVRYSLATRPAFLLASLMPVCVGTAAAIYQGYVFQVGLFALSLLAILLIHAGVNVINDYYDEQNGTDRLNTERLYPFTGGSRFIQNQVLSAEQTFAFAWSLLGTAILLGLLLVWQTGLDLLWIGLAGCLIGWGYSAPPLQLNSRGLGEPAVAISIGVLAPLGAWYVQTSDLAEYPSLIGLPLGLLAMNILLINQFPDAKADAASGKHHWVVRFGVQTAAWIYLSNVLLAGLILICLVIFGCLPSLALVSALPLGLSLSAAFLLKRYAVQTERLVPAIKMTIASVILHGCLLTLSLALV
ncbi:prenyltransferase [uncultured Thiothrix sp.]|uniref:prenyltransferase n=1 Tax=uncultured Thiothrix sp. TaxID=223185 RepID=UPI00261B7A97|nr:prenyltransferase [uncultured Thiothrix sp.]